MKHILLAIFVLIASMPSQASCGDMHQSQGTTQGQHSGMMDHGEMMDHGDMDMNMDCCDHDPLNPSGSCDPASQCRAPAPGAVTIDLSTISVFYNTGQHHVMTDSTPAANRFDTPPLRPPIV